MWGYVYKYPVRIANVISTLCATGPPASCFDYRCDTGFAFAYGCLDNLTGDNIDQNSFLASILFITFSCNKFFLFMDIFFLNSLYGTKRMLLI